MSNKKQECYFCSKVGAISVVGYILCHDCAAERKCDCGKIMTDKEYEEYGMCRACLESVSDDIIAGSIEDEDDLDDFYEDWEDE